MAHPASVDDLESFPAPVASSSQSGLRCENDSAHQKGTTK
jgi:hypothetical protein